MVPIRLRLETSDVGAVSVACSEVVDAITGAIGELLRSELGREADVIEVRIVGADGRPSAPEEVSVVAGFRLREAVRKEGTR